MGGSYEHFSQGDLVQITKPWRQRVGDHSTGGYYVDHPAGLTGVVTGMTNAGFRGLEYMVKVTDGDIGDEPVTAYGISAGDLALVQAVPIKPWPHQRTYRGAAAIGPA